MKRGAWHQCGDKSQLIVLEQLQHGAGVGVIISPRDLPLSSAVRYASSYHNHGAEVIIDQQFYVPTFTNKYLETYPLSSHRISVSRLERITDNDLVQLGAQLRTINADLRADAVLAPALVYEAGRQDIVSLNAKLFAVAKGVGNELGIPTYATAIIGHSATSSDRVMNDVLSQITSLNSDGWYFGFEFTNERIPSSYELTMRCCVAGLTLACTGLPVLHAFAGPASLLSFGFGATGAGIGHFQNLWQFNRDRWAPPTGSGGGGDAPARFFSSALWGTIIYPDELVRLPIPLRTQIMTPTPFCQSISVQARESWDRWNSNKHLVCCISQALAGIASEHDARICANSAISILNNALDLHTKIAGLGVVLKDNTSAYQANWLKVLKDLLSASSKDFDYLSLL